MYSSQKYLRRYQVYYNSDLSWFSIMELKWFIFNLFLLVPGIVGDDDAPNGRRFPKGFIFGTATASYQVEGAWDQDGKGVNIWDTATHLVPSPIDDESTGDIACDSYHKYKEDVALLKDLNVTHYRFSLSWSRIIPNGLYDDVNELGIQFYKNLIKELKDNGIEPLVTLFHWDTPQDIEDIGGWTNEIIIERYLHYAKVCFENFGNDVKYWLTFNEPKQTCEGGYGEGTKAPLVKSPGLGEYLCTHNVVKSHSRTWHLYDNSFRQEQQGLVGMTIDSMWMEPASDSDEDVAAAERALQFTYGWYAHPITKGDYPDVMKEFVGARSEKQGFEHSRLPSFTDEEIESMRNSVDFLGINFYTASLVKNIVDEDKSAVSWSADSEANLYFDPSWETTAAFFVTVTPWGIKKLVTWVHDNYGLPTMITENGYAEDGSSLEDDRRIYYYQQHLSNLRDAMDEGVNLFGYMAWSLMDNFEWTQGYTLKFGLYHVDFNSENRTRTPKKSVEYMRQVFSTRCIVEESLCYD